jgi:hypothetical protein
MQARPSGSPATMIQRLSHTSLYVLDQDQAYPRSAPTCPTSRSC